MTTNADDGARQKPDQRTVVRRTVSNQVAEILRDMILRGQLVPGQSLTHGQIAEMVGVSAMPVREALLKLTYEGFIEAHEHRSFRVASLTRAHVRDSFWVNKKVSAELAARACEHADESLTEALDEISDQADKSRTPEISCWRYHETLNAYAASPNLVMVLRQVARYLPAHYYESSPEWKKRTEASHREITQAIRDKDPERARLLMIAHVDDSEEYLLQYFADEGAWVEPTTERTNYSMRQIDK